MSHLFSILALFCVFISVGLLVSYADADAEKESKTSQSHPQLKKEKKNHNNKDNSAKNQNDKTEEEIAREDWLRRMLPKEIIVVGGGISGLATARRITKNRSNFTVKVFEAQKDRYGGRVWTDKLTNMKVKGFEVELGAHAFNTMVRNNPLIQLAEDFELKMASIDNLQFIIPQKMIAYSGEQLAELTKEAAMILGKALNESSTWKEEVSVTNAVDKIIERGDIASSESPSAEFVKCLPSYIVGDYSTRHYKADAMDVGYDKVLLDGMGELIDRDLIWSRGLFVHIQSYETDGLWEEFKAKVLSVNKTVAGHKMEKVKDVTLTSPAACPCPHYYTLDKPLFLLTKKGERTFNVHGKVMYQILLDEKSVFLNYAPPEQRGSKSVSHFIMSRAFSRKKMCPK